MATRNVPKGETPAPSLEPTTPCLQALNGYTPAQIALVFDSISIHAEAIRDLARPQDEEGKKGIPPWIKDTLIQGQAMLIGALADQMNGFDHIGTVASWATGDGFDLPEGGRP